MSLPDLPEVLRDARQWVLRQDKKPCDLSGKSGGWQSPDFWMDLETAASGLESMPGKFSGLGFIIARNPVRGDRQLIGIDLDACRDPRNGWVSPWALDILRRLNSYTEVSLSGTGFHIWILGKLPDGMDSAESEGQDPGELPPDTWIFIQALKKTAKRCNSLEVYEDGPRHFAMGGARQAEYSPNVEYRQEELNYLLGLCRLQNEKAASHGKTNLPEWANDMAKAAAGKRLPPLNILDVVDTRGWEQSGEQLRGPHPILGSSTGHNTVINPSANLWAYMHNGINSGGDAWLWLACECGAVAWEEAGAGALKSRAVVEKTVAYAVSRQLVAAEEVIREPEIRILRPEDGAGAIGMAPDGTVQTISAPDKGGDELRHVWLSDCALGIHTQTVEDGKREFCFVGKGAKDGRKVRFVASAEDMAEHRKFRAAIINNFGAANRIGKLDFEMVQRITRNTIERERVTIPRWRGGIPLIPGLGLAQDVEFRLSQLTPAEVYPGDLELAKEAFRRILEHRKYSPILIAIILGAPVLARWFKNDRIGAALWGKTGSNKTTISQLYTCVYGLGFLDDRTLLKHGQNGGTAIGAMESILQAGILPRIIDNVKATDSKDAQKYISLIQAVMEGGEKLRGKKDGGLRAIHEFLCTPIITGEVKVSEASTSARVLNLSWSKAADNGNLSWLQENTAILPVIGYEWLRFLAASSRDLREGFDRARASKSAEYAKLGYTNPGRLANIYCLLRGIWTLIEEGPFGEVAIDHREKFLEALEDAIAEQGEEVTAETEIAKFLQAIQNLRASRPDLFMVGDIHGKGDKAIGRETEAGLFLFPEETLACLKQLGVFSQAPSEHSITKALKEEGLLRNTKDRRLNQTTIGQHKVKGWWLNPDWEAGLSHPFGDDKTTPGGNNPEIPAKMKNEKVLEIKKEPFNDNNHDGSNSKTLNEINRDNGINNISIVVDREIDIDFINPVINPIQSQSIPLNIIDVYSELIKPLDIDIDIKMFLDSIKHILNKYPRQDGNGKRGLTVEDLAGEMALKPADTSRILEALKWENTKLGASGITIYWAPAEVLAVLDIAKEGRS